jgi:HlyD family secretion protein
MSKKTRVFVVLGALAIVIAGGWAYKVHADRERPIEVQVAPVERHKIVQTVTATGRIQPVTQVNISADVSAKIIQLPVKLGDWVEKGQLLVALDRERYQAEVESAEANLRSTQAQSVLTQQNVEKTGKDFERANQLFDQHLTSQAELDAARAAYEVEKARYKSTLDQVEQSRAAVKQARDALSKTTIYAPMAGTVSKKNKEVGEIALGSQFQEDVILEVSNLAGMEALVNVDENDIAQLALGNKAKIEVDAVPGTTFEGTVTEIANSAKVSAEGTADQKTDFEVKVAIENPGEQLRPGMTASADIVTDTRESALGVPIQSVATKTPDQLGLAAVPKEATGTAGKEGDRTVADPPATDAPTALKTDKDGFVEVVFVVDDGVAHARQVKTGIQSDTDIEIVDGLKEGESVVTGSYRAISRDLKDGTRVTVGKGDGGKKV